MIFVSVFFRRLFLFLAMAVMTTMSAQQAGAHPHEFVTMKMMAVFNKSGQIQALRYHWEFDEFFSAYAIEGQDKNKNGKAEQDELNALLYEILSNISSIKYFTHFDKNGAVPRFAAAKPIKASMNQRQLVLNFEVPFKAPLDVTKKPLRYAIYDGEFYIAMNHSHENDAVRLRNAPKNCKPEIEAADPSDDLAAFANSLGRNESGGSELGANFAEWVTVSCQ